MARRWAAIQECIDHPIWVIPPKIGSGVPLSSADPYLDGRVDDFRIYNRALTARNIGSYDRIEFEKEISIKVPKEKWEPLDTIIKLVVEMGG